MHGKFDNRQGSMKSRILFVGIEHQFFPGLFGRAGLAHDSRGFTGKSIGIGISVSMTASIDIAMQKNMFPELQPEFGRSRLLNVSASFAF